MKHGGTKMVPKTSRRNDFCEDNPRQHLFNAKPGKNSRPRRRISTTGVDETRWYQDGTKLLLNTKIRRLRRIRIQTDVKMISEKSLFLYKILRRLRQSF